MPSTYIESMLRKAKSDKPSSPLREAEEKPKEAGEGKKVLLDSYGDVKIYREEGEPLLLYEVPAPHYYGTEKVLIDALLQIAIGVIPLDVEALTVEEKRKRYFNKVMEIIDQTPELKVPPNSKAFYANAVVRDMVGYGLIDSLVNDDQLEEIMIIAPNKPVYVFHRRHEMLRTNIIFYEDIDVRNLIDRIARAIGRRIDAQVPLLDARLPDGTRVNATLPPASIDGATLTLRKFKKDPLSVIDLINLGTMSYEVAAFLWLATDGAGAFPANILIAGGTASGKTTTLNVLSSFIPKAERIVSIEDTAELSLPLTHWIRLEVRPPSVEGTGEITMNDLVKNSIRMRPDRILVGEIRGAEGYTMFAAMNTGHRGVMGTVHANSARETIVRLTSPPISVPSIMVSSLNLIVMQNRIHDRRKGTLRRITEIAEVSPSEEGDKQDLQVIYSYDPVKDEIFETGSPSLYFHQLKKYTGLSDEALKQEVADRVRILKDLNNKNVRSLNDACEVTQNYVASRRLKL